MSEPLTSEEKQLLKGLRRRQAKEIRDQKRVRKYTSRLKENKVGKCS